MNYNGESSGPAQQCNANIPYLTQQDVPVTLQKNLLCLGVLLSGGLSLQPNGDWLYSACVSALVRVLRLTDDEVLEKRLQIQYLEKRFIISRMTGKQGPPIPVGAGRKCERGCSPWLIAGMKLILYLTLISWCLSISESLICFIQQFESQNISRIKGQGPNFSQVLSAGSKRWEIKLCCHVTSIIYGLREKTLETSIISPIRSQVRNIYHSNKC